MGRGRPIAVQTDETKATRAAVAWVALAPTVETVDRWAVMAPTAADPTDLEAASGWDMSRRATNRQSTKCVADPVVANAQ